MHNNLYVRMCYLKIRMIQKNNIIITYVTYVVIICIILVFKLN